MVESAAGDTPSTHLTESEIPGRTDAALAIPGLVYTPSYGSSVKPG
jgi:hypothetical protein